MEGIQSTSTGMTSQQNKSSSSSVKPKPKIPLELNIAFTPVGDYAAKFSTRAGEFIRMHVPVNFHGWKKVPVNFKDDVWKALMDEFELPVDQKHCRDVIETGFPPLFRRFKSDLRDLVRGKKRRRSKKRPALSEDGSVVPEEASEEPQQLELTPELWEAARDKVPAGMNTNIWHDFVDYEKQPAVIAKHKANAAARKRATLRHTLGRCSYNNKKYKLDESGILQVPEDTTDKWLLGHQRKDGTVHPSALEEHKQVTEAKEKYKEAGESSGKSSLVSEPLEDVFGPNRKDSIRGYSSRTSKKQAQMAAIAFSALQNKDSQNERRLNKIETDVSDLGGQMGSLTSKVDVILNLLKANVSAPTSSSHPPRRVTPSPEKGSTTHPAGENHHAGGSHHSGGSHSSGGGHHNLEDEEIASTTIATGQSVELLDNKGKVIALGCVHPGTHVHCKPLKPTESRVFIEEVLDQAGVLWDPPQGDDYCFLRQLPPPMWVRWGKERLRVARSESF